jgi:holliday junction DNA helicase RuvB
MVIKTTQSSDTKQKSQEKVERVVSPTEKESDVVLNLRPKTLELYVGQEVLKKHLRVSIDSAKIRKEPLEHILFYGPPGLWKTTISNIIANEMETKIKTSSGPAIEKQSDLVSILSNLEEWDILFIDEIHRLRSAVEEILYTAMEDNYIDIMVGKGTGAQSVRLPVKPFTLVWATTKLSSLSAPLRDRFWNVLKLDFYTTDDIQYIIQNNAKLIWFSLTDECLEKLSKRSRGTPRVANRLLKILRDYHTIGKDISKIEVLKEVFESIGIDDLWLDYLDRKIITIISEKFSGWPVGLNTVASAVWEEESTIEDVVEPYLLQIGFLERTPRGRKITGEAIEYLKKMK